MSIRVRLNPLLQQFTGGREVVETSGGTIGECLDNLEIQFPGIKHKICDQQGQILSNYEILVNGESTYPNEFTSPINDGDEMTILVILIGG